MIPSPIHKALLTFQKCSAQFLLMGGQACILYGAAEFSRDLDLSVDIDERSLDSVSVALKELQAETIFVPPLEAAALSRGHACHFRCHTPGAEGLRIDIMSRMRGCDDFESLWRRRSVVHLPEIGDVGVLSLPDLVRAKKTQREKDWPMIRRLIEADVLHNRSTPTDDQLRFWFLECRTPSELVRLAKEHSQLCRLLLAERPLLEHAISRNESFLQSALLDEELKERERDREYWRPLRSELERWRREPH